MCHNKRPTFSIALVWQWPLEVALWITTALLFCVSRFLNQWQDLVQLSCMGLGGGQGVGCVFLTPATWLQTRRGREQPEGKLCISGEEWARILMGKNMFLCHLRADLKADQERMKPLSLKAVFLSISHSYIVDCCGWDGHKLVSQLTLNDHILSPCFPWWSTLPTISLPSFTFLPQPLPLHQGCDPWCRTGEKTCWREGC